jgi:hypothetical protein
MTKRSSGRGRAWVLAATLMAALVAPALAQKADPKFDAWLEKNRLGPHQKDENWDDVVAAARKEGEVAVYSSTGTMLKVAEDFAKAYPEIKVKAYDLGSEKTIEKIVREHQAGVYAADIVYSGGTEQMVFDLLPNHRIVNYVPAYLKDRIPAAADQEHLGTDRAAVEGPLLHEVAGRIADDADDPRGHRRAFRCLREILREACGQEAQAVGRDRECRV